jgi:hypothetical protein
VSDFDALHSGKHNDEVQLYGFDILRRSWTRSIVPNGADQTAFVNRRWTGTPDRRPKGTPLIGES